MGLARRPAPLLWITREPEPQQRNSTSIPTTEISHSSKCMPSDEQWYWKNPCIYRVPAVITELNLKDYQPQVVSFGPYHHYDEHLLPMEEHKLRACDHLLKRSKKSLEPVLKSLRKVEHELKDSYNALDPKWKVGMGDQFLELMITDGCFMLEIMITAMTKENENDYASNDPIDYAPNDPIFGTRRYITAYIRRDMLMLENQLPMLVLYQLVTAMYDVKNADEYINELILKFYSFDLGIEGMGRSLHVLDVFRKGQLMESGKDQHERENVGSEAGEGNNSSLHTVITGMGDVVDVSSKCLPKNAENVHSKKIIRSATELNEAGIRFEKSKTISLKDISFAGRVLKLPVIMVDDDVKSNFLNVMTFERLHIGAGTEVTSYVIFMDNIINNERDVALLHAQGIILNSIGSNEAVAEIFNSLCKEVTLAPNISHERVQNEISKHCNKRRNVWRAYLNRYYLKNPWTILSLIAAIFLFALTIIQTVYALLDYY